MKRFPHPLALLAGCVVLAAALSHIVPAGRYERRDDPATGRSVVVPGTYHRVAPTPVGPFAAVVAIPKGMASAGEVIFLVLLVGGAFVVVERTGALGTATRWLAARLEQRATLVIPAVAAFFAAGGVLENMGEEIIALVPVLLVLNRRLGFDAVTAVAMSIGAAAVGAAFSPINPFQVGIAQKLAQLPLLSAWGYRTVALGLALGLWVAWTMRYAARTREAPALEPAGAGEAAGQSATRHGAVLSLVLAAFVVFVVGILRWGWDFDHISAMFFVMGVLAGIVGGLGVSGTAAAFAEGFGAMAYAAALIGFARAIFVVLDQGGIIDTLVHGLFAPIAGLPTALGALAMMAAQALIHVPVPSVSGQAVLTMPVLVPLGDLMGLQRQAVVLAYQYGAGLSDLLTPTNGALMAVLAAAGVSYDRWMRFAVPRAAALFALGGGTLVLAVALGVH